LHGVSCENYIDHQSLKIKGVD